MASKSSTLLGLFTILLMFAIASSRRIEAEAMAEVVVDAGEGEIETIELVRSSMLPQAAGRCLQYSCQTNNDCRRMGGACAVCHPRGYCLNR